MSARFDPSASTAAHARDVPSRRIPRLARWLLSAAAPPAERAFLLDDLDEEFDALARREGSRRAVAWCAAQVALSLGPLSLARLRALRGTLPHALGGAPAPPEPVRHLVTTPPRRGDPMLTQLRDDLRYSVRVAARRPWLSAIVIATAALGVGTTTAVFGVVDALLLRPLAFPESERLVRLTSPIPDHPTWPAVNLADFTDLAAESRSFSSLALYDFGGGTAQVGDEPESVRLVQAGPGFGETLALRPVLGRFFTAEEYLPGGPLAVILTHAYWVSRFTADSAIVGRTILLSGRPRTVVGVLPPARTEFPQGDFHLWAPLVIPDDSYLRGRYSMQLNAIGRLAPGVTIVHANTEIATFARRLAAEFPETNTHRTLHVAPLRDTIVGPVRPMLVLLSGAVAAVLLIACANLGTLLLAHSQARVREFAVRAAIGGAAGRIARQLLVESVSLTLVGGALGIWLARALLDGLVAVYPERLPRAGEIALDWRVLAVAIGTTLVAGLLAGLPLARQVHRLDLTRDLREGERGLGSRGRRRVLGGLVVAQLAASVALLFGATLLLRTFIDMTAIRPGFDTRGVLTMGVAISPVRYPTPERQSQFYDALFDSLRTIPGVQEVGWGMFAPLGGGNWGDSFIRQGTADAPPNLPSMQVRMVSPEYPSVLRVPLLAGRMLSHADRSGAPDVALVNAALAAAYYRGTSPVGKRVTFQERTVEIVGVLGDARNRTLWEAPTPEIYLPIEQWGWRGGVVFIRAAADPALVEPRVRAAVRGLDPSIPFGGLRTLEERVRRSMAPERFRAVLVGTLAALALLLSVLGIYGLVTYVVSRRTREIGIRIALGEATDRVRRRVLLDACRLAVLGVCVGALLALASSRWLQAFVAGDVRARDPWTLLATMLLLLFVTAAAAWLPARRASRVDPLVAIRTE